MYLPIGEKSRLDSTDTLALNFDGVSSSEGMATGTFLFNYVNLLKDISGSVSDYTWGLTIKKTDKALQSSVANTSIQVSNVKLLDQNKKVLAEEKRTYDVSNAAKSWKFTIQ